VSYTHPHEPYLCRQAFWDLYENPPVPPPLTGPLPEAEHDPHALRLLKDFGMLGIDFKTEDIQRARRAYYGSISYIDTLLGKLLSALHSSGLAGKTAIVFTSDHGDMLGERGLWFKKHFYEPSLRVPLFIQAPWLEPQRVTELVSLVDLLPTFNGLATGEPWSATTEPLEGMDLTPLLRQQATPSTRTVYAEYLAEATPVPMFMIRRGHYKFIASSHDGHQLFDLHNDPQERVNLCEHTEHSAQVDEFLTEVRVKWNESELTARILRSQKRRALIRQALQAGEPVRWNHGERAGESVRWYRGEGGYNEWAFDYLPVIDPATDEALRDNIERRCLELPNEFE
jgi:choline-sulfatase